MYIYISISRTFSRAYCQEMFGHLSTCSLVSLENEVENSADLQMGFEPVGQYRTIIKLLPNLN